MTVEIKYDSKDLNPLLRSRMDAFLERLTKANAAKTIGDEQLEQSRRVAAAVRHQLDTMFQLVVLGDFKRGKSTVINDLLGAAIAPVDVAPETCTVNCFEYSNDVTVTAELVDGGKIKLQPEQLKREVLEPLLGGLQHPVRRLRIGVPAAILNGLTLVDTPGLGEGSDDLDLAVREYLKEAEAIVYVISALSPLSQSEQEYLQQAVAPQEFAKVCFVVNFLDLCETQKDADHVMASIRG